MKCIICLKHLFYVTDPNSSFAWPHIYWERRNGHSEQIIVTSNIDLSTRWKEIINSSRHEHWYCQWKCLRQAFYSKHNERSKTKIVFIILSTKQILCFNNGFLSLTRVPWKFPYKYFFCHLHWVGVVNANHTRVHHISSNQHLFVIYFRYFERAIA